MNIFNVPVGFWEEHTLLFATLVVSITLNLFLLGLSLARWSADSLERKAKDRMEMIEQIVERVKREMKVQSNS